jgi:hypothetical protein
MGKTTKIDKDPQAEEYLRELLMSDEGCAPIDTARKALDEKRVCK